LVYLIVTSRGNFFLRMIGILETSYSRCRGYFFPHSYLTKLTVALAHSFLEHDRDGEPVFLVLLDFGAVISGVGFVSCGSTHFANVRSEDRTDQLASVWISQNMAAKLILGFAIVFAKFAFSSWLNSEVRPGTGLILTSHWNWKLLRRTGQIHNRLHFRQSDVPKKRLLRSSLRRLRLLQEFSLRLIKRPTNVLRIGKVMGASDCSGSQRSLLIFVGTAATAAIAGARHAARTIVESKVHD